MMLRLKCGGAVVRKARTKKVAQYKSMRSKTMTTKKMMMMLKTKTLPRTRRFKDAFAASKSGIRSNSVNVILI